MADVIPLNCITRFDIPVDRVLESAKGCLEDVVIIGYDTDGELYFATNKADGADVLWFLEKAKQMLLAIGSRDI